MQQAGVAAIPKVSNRKGEATRTALMQAGFQIFAARGYLRAQIGDIARAAQKSSGVFYLYFKSKDELLDAWLDDCDATVPWIHADTSLLFEKARSFILHSYWSVYERFGPVLDALDAAALVSDHFKDRQTALHNRNHESLARMIRHAQAEGRYMGIDPELTAISIGTLISKTTSYWFAHRQVLEARGFDKNAAMRNLEILYARLLEGGDLAAARPEPRKAATRKKRARS